MKYAHEISQDTFKGYPVLVVEGDMTSDADADVKSAYAEIKRSKPIDTLIVNFEKTRYINSSGIATLINIIQDVQELNGTIYFIGLSDHFKKVMDIVGISDFVEIHSDESELKKVL